MINRKGPFGCYATDEIRSDVSVCEYAMAVINGNSSGCFLPCIINRYGEVKEFSFDYSGLIPLTEFDGAGSAKHKFPNLLSHGDRMKQRRKAAGTFLMQIPILINNLLPPEGIVLTLKNIYTDKDGTVLKCCYRPAEYKSSSLRLSSLNEEDMETLINTDFISEVLTEDEKQSILHAISTGDEDMYCNSCRIIMSGKGTDTKEGKNRLPLSKDLSVRSDLIIPSLTVICSVYSLQNIGRKAAFLFAAAGLILTAHVIWKDRNTKEKTNAVKKEDGDYQGQLRRKILFSKPRSEPVSNDSVYTGDSKDNCFEINYASLRSLTKEISSDGIPREERYSIYTNKVTVGSDQFLSDIVIDDDSVESQHAVITFENKLYYLTDLSISHQTYIDDKSLLPNKRYEIKNKQKLTFGNKDYKFLISFAESAEDSVERY